MLRHQISGTVVVDGMSTYANRALGTWLRWLAEHNPGHWIGTLDFEALAILDARGFRIRLDPVWGEGGQRHSMFAEVGRMSTDAFAHECKRAGIRFEGDRQLVRRPALDHPDPRVRRRDRSARGRAEPLRGTGETLAKPASPIRSTQRRDLLVEAGDADIEKVKCSRARVWSVEVWICTLPHLARA